MRFSRFLWLALWLAVLPLATRAGLIKGKVSGPDGAGLPFANVAVRGAAAVGTSKLGAPRQSARKKRAAGRAALFCEAKSGTTVG